MNNLHTLAGKPVELEISGKMLSIHGNLIEFGKDILVIYNGKDFLYIPSIHVQHIKLALKADFESADLPGTPLENQADSIDYRKILTNATGLFVELYVMGKHSIHGYLTSVKDDFLVLNSPIFHTVVISLNHIKYLIPYNSDSTPYLLKKEHFFLVRPFNMELANTFEQQLKKLEGVFIVLDLGENPKKIGLLKKFEDQTLELVIADGSSVYMHLEHLKTIHLP
ncbi:MAG: hypothetical protein JWM44_2185 [Bacilli bacterium]|nr:hypothetical protein [Bacilli bacterium]